MRWYGWAASAFALCYAILVPVFYILTDGEISKGMQANFITWGVVIGVTTGLIVALAVDRKWSK